MLSEELLLARAGNFTASENHRLMAGWDTPAPNTSFDEYVDLRSVIEPMYLDGQRKFLVGELNPMFEFKVTTKLITQTLDAIRYDRPSAGLITYAQEKAMETLFDPDPSLQFSTVHTRNGDEREVECMEILAEKTGLNFVATGEDQAHIHTGEIGCTPDGVVYDDCDLVITGAEAKCKSPLVHAKNLLINNGEDLKTMAFDHFVQIQTAMLVTGADNWYFANYNPYAKSSDLQFKYIIIKRDGFFISILKQRISVAKKIKHDFLANFNQYQTKEAA